MCWPQASLPPAPHWPASLGHGLWLARLHQADPGPASPSFRVSPDQLLPVLGHRAHPALVNSNPSPWTWTWAWKPIYKTKNKRTKVKYWDFKCDFLNDTLCKILFNLKFSLVFIWQLQCNPMCTELMLSWSDFLFNSQPLFIAWRIMVFAVFVPRHHVMSFAI